MKDTKIRTEKELLKMSLDDQRRTLIAQLTTWTENSVSRLQSLSNIDLAEILGCGFLAINRTATEVVNFEWHSDNLRVVKKTPTFLSQQLNNNCNSTVPIPMTDTFTISETVTESTTFE